MLGVNYFIYIQWAYVLQLQVNQPINCTDQYTQINQQNNLPPLWLALHKYINYLRFYKCIYYFFPKQLKTVLSCFIILMFIKEMLLKSQMQNGILQNEFCFPTGLHYRTGDAMPIKKLLQCIHIDTILICRCLHTSARESVFSSRYGDPPFGQSATGGFPRHRTFSVQTGKSSRQTGSVSNPHSRRRGRINHGT